MDNVSYAWRMLRKNPGVTAVAVVTLGLGIGANTAIFSVVDAALLRPLPYRDPGQLVTFSNRFRDRPVPVSVMEIDDYRQQSGVFAQAAAVLVFDANMTGGDQPERLQAVGVSANYFDILGVGAQLGRTFSADEQRPSWTEIVVISDGLWQRRFGGAPDIIGKKIWIDEDPWTVVGVMPPGFKHPDGHVKGSVDAWLPSGFAAEPFPEPKRQTRFLQVMGRLKPGVTVEAARTALATVAERLKAQYPDTYGAEVAPWGIELDKLEEQVVGGARPVLWLLLGAVVLVLLIACSNVANLLLARATGRVQEMAIRKALGATRRHLIGQLLTESVFLALVGGALGFLVASWGVQLLVAFAPAGLPRVHEIQLDLRILAFTISVSVACGLFFGMFPALQSSRIEPQAAMKEGGAAIGGSGRRHRLLGGLVVGEFALALVVLGVAGLLLRSLWNAAEVRPGFDARGVLTARVWLPQPNKLEAGRYQKLPQRLLLYRQLIERLEAEPSVEAAALVGTVPLDRDPNRFGRVAIAPEGQVGKGEVNIVQTNVVSADYFRTLRIPIVAGRTFDVNDKVDAAGVAIVNQTLARHLWPGQDAIGKRYQFVGANAPKDQKWTTIVGVVADVKTNGLDAPTADELFFPYTQGIDLATGIAVRARGGSAAAMAPILRAAVHELDPTLPLFDVATLEEVLAQAMAARRFLATLIGVFAAVALALAALGIYGVMAYSVSQRRREIALRVALGARERDVLGMVIGQGLRLVGVSLVLGVGALLVGTRVIASLLFGVSPTDAATFGSIGALLVAVAVVATWLPARRAARTSPMAALRSD